MKLRTPKVYRQAAKPYALGLPLFALDLRLASQDPAAWLAEPQDLRMNGNHLLPWRVRRVAKAVERAEFCATIGCGGKRSASV